MKKDKKDGPLTLTDRLSDFLKLMEAENLQELEISEGSFHVKLVRQGAGQVPVQINLPLQAGAVSNVEAPVEVPIDGTPIKAPIAGVFYRASSPNAPVFVSEGDIVAPGQIVGIIEAMKVMNEITSEVGGKIRKILAENGKPVDPDTVLFILDNA